MRNFVELEINRHFSKRVVALFKLTPKEQKLLILLLCLIALGIVLRFTLTDYREKEAEIRIEPSLHKNGEGELLPVEEKLIIVHITGAVHKPGVYILEEGSRVFHAVEKAGGHLSDADLEKINLAEPLYDGQPVHVPRKNEENRSGAGNADLHREEAFSPAGKLNINRADQSQLERLPGIGAVKAQNIINYRNKNGPFKNIEELVKVSGIGDKTLEGIRELITIY